MKKTKKKLSQIVICLVMALTLCLNGVGMIAASAADEPTEDHEAHEEHEHTEHSFDDNGVCADCDTLAQAKGGDSYYATVNEAIDAVVAAIAENPYVSDGERTVTVYADQDEFIEIPEGVIFDGNGKAFNNAVNNYGTIVGGVYNVYIYNAGVIKKAVFNGWYSGMEGSLIVRENIEDIVYGENYLLFGNAGSVECSDHLGGEATCHTLAKCDFCGAEHGNYLDHTVGEDGNCVDCGAPAPVEVNGVYYSTVDEALAAVVALLESSNKTEEPAADEPRTDEEAPRNDEEAPRNDEQAPEVEIELNDEEAPRDDERAPEDLLAEAEAEKEENLPAAEERTVKLRKDVTLDLVVPEYVIFDGNGFKISSDANATENYGEIVGGVFTGIFYNYGKLTNVTIDGWFFNYEGGEVVSTEESPVKVGEYFAFLAKEGSIECDAHDGGDATCHTLANCELCGESYGEFAAHSVGAEGDIAATCENKAYCSVCESEYGEMLDHVLSDATCTDPQTCEECEAEEGLTLDHEFADATCTTPKTCTICGETEGEALGHDFADATCTTPKTCTVCETTEGEPIAHVYGEWTVTKEAKEGVAGEKKRVCACGASETEVIEALPKSEPAPANDPEPEPTPAPASETEAATEAPATEAATDAPADEKKSGCGSVISGSVIAAVFAGALGAIAIKGKKED